MHKARFTGDRKALRYVNDGWRYNSRPDIYSYYRPLPYDPWEDTNLIYEGELDDPPLVTGQTIYLHTLKKSVKVEKVLRSTDGAYTYLTDYEIETFEDKETIDGKEHCERVLRHWEEKYEGDTLPRGEAPGDTKPWWKRLFA